MSAVTADVGIPRTRGERSPLAVLARVEAGRFARHPLFLVCAAGVAWGMVTLHTDAYATKDVAALELSLGPAFLMGLGGLVVAYRLTRSTRRADEAVASAPSDEPLRTAALLLACLVPFSVAALAMAQVVVAWHVEPMTWANVWDHFTPLQRDSMMAGGALAGLGGPVLGVCLGRWWRWPGAALLAVVVLVAWSVLTLAPWDSPFGRVWHMSSPYVLWYSGTKEDPTLDVLGGSPTLRVLYLLTLIGLAASTAMLHGAAGARQQLLRRWVVGLAVAAVMTMLVAALTGPDFVTLPAQD
jgi:hypothetical protein